MKELIDWNDPKNNSLIYQRVQEVVEFDKAIDWDYLAEPENHDKLQKAADDLAYEIELRFNEVDLLIGFNGYIQDCLSTGVSAKDIAEGIINREYL